MGMCLRWLPSCGGAYLFTEAPPPEVTEEAPHTIYFPLTFPFDAPLIDGQEVDHWNAVSSVADRFIERCDADRIPLPLCEPW